MLSDAERDNEGIEDACIYKYIIQLTRVLVGEGKGERGGVSQRRALRADAATALGLAEVHHVQRQGKVLVVLDRVSAQQFRHLLDRSSLSVFDFSYNARAVYVGIYIVRNS